MYTMWETNLKKSETILKQCGGIKGKRRENEGIAMCPGFSRVGLIFLPVAAVFWILCERNVDNTLTVLVVAKKSRTFFNFPYSADEQLCRS